jgi:hypothetical protein
LKFPLDFVYHLFYTLIQKYKKNFNNNDNEKININNLTKNLSFLQEIKADLSLSFNFLKGKSAKTRWNINKKLNHLIRISLQIIDKLNNDKLIFLSRDEEIMNKLIEKFLKQSSGSYLRMEENEELYHNIYRI